MRLRIDVLLLTCLGDGQGNPKTAGSSFCTIILICFETKSIDLKYFLVVSAATCHTSISSHRCASELPQNHYNVH